MMRRPLHTALLSLLLLAPLAWAQPSLRIHLPEPVWELDASTTPLRAREAGLPPEEADLAGRLRPLITQGKHQAAIDLLEQSEQGSFSPAMHFIHAQLHMAEGNYESAAAAYRATLADMPDFLRAHRGLGMVYLQLGKREQARQHLSKALELGANDAQIYGQLSYLNMLDDKPYSAVSGYRRALFFEPDNRQWQLGLLQALVRSGDYMPARTLLEQLLQANPGDPGLWLQWGNIALRTNDNVAALGGLEFAIRLGEDHPDNLALAGQLHLQSGNSERGVALLESVLEARPQDYPALAHIIDWLLQTGRFQNAQRLAATARQDADNLDDVQHSRLLTQLAQIRLADEDTDSAIALLEQAGHLDPANGRALITLAGALEDSNPAQAESLYSRAQALPAFREAALIAHASLAAASKDYAQALDLLETAARDSPDKANIANNINILQRIIAQQSDAGSNTAVSTP